MRECSPAASAGLVQIAFLGDFHRTVVGKSHACFGVEVQPPTLAPLLELCGANDGSNNGAARSALVFFPSCGGLEPFGVGSVQGVAIGHEALDFLEVLFQVPGHAND